MPRYSAHIWQWKYYCYTDQATLQATHLPTNTTASPQHLILILILTTYLYAKLTYCIISLIDHFDLLRADVM